MRNRRRTRGSTAEVPHAGSAERDEGLCARQASSCDSGESVTASQTHGHAAAYITEYLRSHRRAVGSTFVVVLSGPKP